MTREEIIAMVQEAVIGSPTNENPFDFRLLQIETIESFAALVAAHEREACAKICEAIGNDAEIDELICSALQQADETIRARGKEMPR